MYVRVTRIRAVNTRPSWGGGKRHTESARVSPVHKEQRVMDFTTPQACPLTVFFFFFPFVLPRVQPYCYRVESRATTLVLITIRIYEVLSLRQPNLVPISHRIQPISICIYTWHGIRVAARSRLFLRFPARLSIYNNSVGETWVHFTYCFSVKVRALYLYRVSRSRFCCDYAVMSYVTFALKYFLYCCE